MCKVSGMYEFTDQDAFLSRVAPRHWSFSRVLQTRLQGVSGDRHRVSGRDRMFNLRWLRLFSPRPEDADESVRTSRRHQYVTLVNVLCMGLIEYWQNMFHWRCWLAIWRKTSSTSMKNNCTFYNHTIAIHQNRQVADIIITCSSVSVRQLQGTFWIHRFNCLRHVCISILSVITNTYSEMFTEKEDDMQIQQAVHQRFGSVTDAVLYRRHSDETTREPWRDLDETKLSPQEMCDPTRPESGYVSDYVTDPRLQTSAATQNEIVSDDDSDEMMSLNPVHCSPTQDGQSNGGGYKFKNHIQHRYTVKDTIVSQATRPIPPPSSSLSSSLSSLSTLSSHYLPPENSSVDPARNEQTSSPGRCRNVTDSLEKPHSSGGKMLNEPSGVMPPLIGIDQSAIHGVDRISEVRGSGYNASRNGAVMTRPKTIADDTDNVPGFALHPSGSFYLPVVVPSDAVAVAMLNYSSMGLCHPVSINVRFGVPKPLDGAAERHSHRTPDGASTVAPQRSSEGSREISHCPSNNTGMFETQCNNAQRNVWSQRYITTG